jgi:hypothetical protein
VSGAPQATSSRPPQIVSTLWFFASAGPLVASVLLSPWLLSWSFGGPQQNSALWPLAVLGLPIVVGWIYLVGVLAAAAVGGTAHLTRTWTAGPWAILRYVGLAAVGAGMAYVSTEFGVNLIGASDRSTKGSLISPAAGAISAVLTALWAAKRRLI